MHLNTYYSLYCAVQLILLIFSRCTDIESDCYRCEHCDREEGTSSWNPFYQNRGIPHAHARHESNTARNEPVLLGTVGTHAV